MKLEGGDTSESMSRRLVDLMPLDSMVTDLWDWGIHFEKYSFDDIENAAFCIGDELNSYAEYLAEDFERWIDEYGMDYDQHGWEMPEAFSTWIKEECLKFMKQWRANVQEKFGR